MHDSKKGALARIIVLIVMVINSFLAHYGHSPIPVSEEFVYQFLSDLVLLGALGWLGIYKDNPVTDEGVKGTAVTHKLKNKKLSADEQTAFTQVKEEITK